MARVGMPTPPSEERTKLVKRVLAPSLWDRAMNWSKEMEFFKPVVAKLISSPVRKVSPLSWPPILLTLG